MGDVAMTVPVLLNLLEQHPEVRITILSRPFFKPFFKDLPRTHFFSVDLKERHKGFLGLLRLFYDVRKLKIDVVADLHNVLRSKVVRTLFLLTAHKTAYTDKGRKEKKQLTRLENKEIYPLKNMFERHLSTFVQLGFAIDLSKPNVLPTQTITESITGKIIFDSTKKNIGIAPFAQYYSKVYPKDLMQQVVDELASNADCQLYLFGGGNKEIILLKEMKQNHQNVHLVAGALSFEDELTLISNLDVMLSMDSGNAHIAAMFGVKVVTLWGATHPYAGFSPFNQPKENSIVSDREKFPFLPTSVYGNKKVSGYEEVMRSIAPTAIIEKIKKII
jgi:ADP-heptose:LPS heptosyltransferase